MKQISQIARLTGVSIRTLQYYDEIGLLKPSALTSSGYRLYDDEALETLQQILFFKELGFSLHEIKEILEAPDFDRIAAFKKQKELFLLKRNRINRLIQLLDRLEKGETCMSFKEFDLSDYIQALEDFKTSQAEEVAKHWGSVENFDLFIQKIRDDEEHVARLAISEFGSVEAYTEAMKHNLEHFSEIMETYASQIPDELKKEDPFATLTSHRGEDAGSPAVRTLVNNIVMRADKYANLNAWNGPDGYCRMIIDLYSNDYHKRITDTHYGEGASDYIVEAFRSYLDDYEKDSVQGNSVPS